jgi:hypothetical protein
VRHPGAGRARHDVPGVDRMRLVAEQQRAGAGEHDEHLLFGGVAVRRPAQRVRRDLQVAQPGARRSQCAPEVAPDDGDVAAAALLGRHVGDRDDARRAGRGLLVQVDRAGVGLALERVRRPAGLGPGRADPGDPGARQAADLGPAALAEQQRLQAAGAADQGVRSAPRAVQERVAGAHLVGRAVLPGQARPGEHEAELLLGVVGVRGGALGARRDPRAAQADVHRPGRRAQVRPGAAHRPRLHHPLGHRIPVTHHPAAMLVIRLRRHVPT